MNRPFPSATRSLISICVAGLAVLSMVSMVGCSLSRPKAFFPITYWCPPPSEDARYKEAADCGFNLAFNGDPDLARKYGMKCLVFDQRVIAAVAKPGPKTDRGLDEVITQYGNHPAFWGFYLKDEPGAAKFADLAHVNQYLIAKRPGCVPVVNLLPTYANERQLGTKTYAEHVERFMSEVKPRVLSYDHYALMKDGTERPDYFANMEIIRAAGLKYDVPYWYIFLITPHYGYRDPSEGDLRWQIYTSLAYGYKGLCYFTYWSVRAKGFGESIIGRDGERTSRYALAGKLNAEINSIGPVLAALRSTSVYQTADKLPDGTRGPAPDSLIQKSEGGDLVVGELRDPDGRRYLLLANASPRNAVTAQVTFLEGVDIKAELKRGSTAVEDVRVNGNPAKAAIALSAGDDRLFEVEVEPK